MKTKLLILLTIICFGPIAHSQTTFADVASISSTASTPYNIASGLINSDSFNDIVVGTYYGNSLEVYMNNTDGTFGSTVALTNSLVGISGLKLVDIDNDTDLDIVASGFGADADGVGGKIVWFANDGNGNYGLEQEIASLIGSSGLAIGDIDNNGTLDIAAASNFNNQILWYSHDGSGGFSAGVVIDNTVVSPAIINFEDIDLDGDLDFVAGSSDFNNCKIEVFRSNFIGSSVVSYTKDANSVTTGKYFLFNANFADVDEDGDFDILATDVAYNSFPAGAYWYRNDSDVFTEVALPTTLANPSVAQLKDLDNDDTVDLIISNGQGQAILPNNPDIAWFKGNGDGTFGAENVIDNTQSQVFVYSVVDLDNDGDLDIATCSYNQNALNWLENEQIVLNIPTAESINFKIFPNPTKDILNFEGFDAISIEVSIFDVLGKNILNKSLTTDHTLNVSQLVSGIYTIKVNGIFASKFIKE